jgi:spermidine/putrescine transport system ATP-binding protein
MQTMEHETRNHADATGRPGVERDPAIELRGVSKRFGQVAAVRDCTLTIARGSFVSLLGPSGCGKTTLLRIIGGFEHQDVGTVLVHGVAVDRLPPNKRDVNTVFQRYALFPHKNVFENVAFPLEIMRVPKRERETRVCEMLSLVHLEGMERRRADQLSGGQAQRVALARALAGRPEVLLLDEPLAALDLKLRKAMQFELRRIQEEVGTTFLYVTHDQEEALTMSDMIVLMEHGEVVQAGAPAEIYERPTSLFASQFIGEANFLHGEVTEVTPSALTITTSGIQVVAPPVPGMATGDKAVLSLRPERLTVRNGQSEERAHGENCVSGVVGRQVYLGNLRRFLVEVETGITLTVEQGAADAETLELGARVAVSWSPEAVVVLRDGD